MVEILLAHEWLEKIGGSENVFEQMMMSFPEAELACLWNNGQDRFGPAVKESWLACTPLRGSKRLALPAMPIAWRQFRVKRYDKVIVSSHAFAHHLAARAARASIPAYAYVHTPARYLWAPELDVRGKDPLARIGGMLLRGVDRRTATPMVSYAANSQFVRRRIRESWGQDARVIYPPVEVHRVLAKGVWPDWLPEPEAALMDALPQGFILGASRMVPYKQLDGAIRVGEHLGRPVVLAGVGPDEGRLRALAQEATVPVYFVGRASDELLIALYQTAALYVFFAIEDFGIMPVEAMAAGTPVMVNCRGGSREAVSLVGLGVIVDPYDEDDVLHKAELALGMKGQPPATIARFSAERFRRELAAWASAETSERPYASL